MTVLWIATSEGATKAEMPDPAYKGYTTKKEELVKAERNVGSVMKMVIEGAVYSAEAGELIKHHIAWKYTVDVKWTGLTPAQKNAIMSKTGGEWFYVDFIDMETDTKITNVTMYKGTGQTITGWGKFDPATGQFQYYDISMSLVQK